MSHNFRLPCLKFLLLSLVIFTAATSKSSAQNVANEDLVKEIEKTLLFDKSATEQIDVYKQKNQIKRKGGLEINHGDASQDSQSQIDIVVVDPKVTNFDIREKEKLAYNSSLIGQYEVAVEIYKQVISAEPDNKNAKFSLAVVYQQMGQLRQAKEIYYQMLRSDVDNKEEIVGNLLAILVEEAPKDAIYLLSRLTTENPQSSYILAHAALAYDKVENYDQAISLLKRAVLADPTRLDYKYNLAVIYDKTKDYDNAILLYSELVKNSANVGNSIPLEQIKKRIEFLRNE